MFITISMAKETERLKIILHYLFNNKLLCSFCSCSTMGINVAPRLDQYDKNEAPMWCLLSFFFPFLKTTGNVVYGAKHLRVFAEE
jgi:hypothetical protein